MARNRINITHVVILSDFLRKRFLWKQDPEKYKPQGDNRLKARESISKVALSSKLYFDEGSVNFPFIYKYLETTKSTQDDLCVLRDSVVSGSCVQVSLLSTFAGSNFCDFAAFSAFN